jgi:isocitrate dehydrogenase
MNESHPAAHVTLIPGDGIGPECIAAVRRVIAAAGVEIAWEEGEAGAAVFRKGDPTGVPRETIDSIQRNRVALKGPLATPVGYGERSANVTLRGVFELYGNIRPTRELPGVQAVFAGRQIDLVVVRENVEDLYAGIEHMQTPGVAQGLKLITRKGCEKIVRLAFEIARSEGRRKVTCSTKSNIMKLTEGLLKRTFEEIADEYPDLQTEHLIIDNLAHQLVRWPEQYEVIVTTNLNGDIISDLTSGLTGGLGLAASANVGRDVAIFEAVHGSAPGIAGRGVANPTALLLSAVMLLRHIGAIAAADRIEHAIVVTLEEGRKLTPDLTLQEHAVTTDEYTDEIIRNLGRQSAHWRLRERRPLDLARPGRETAPVRAGRRRVVGVDVFIEAEARPAELGAALERLAGAELRLKMISNRGTQVYPPFGRQPDCADHWCCRFVLGPAQGEAHDELIVELLGRLSSAGIRWMHLEKLQEFDGIPAFSKAQGES